MRHQGPATKGLCAVNTSVSDEIRARLDDPEQRMQPSVAQAPEHGAEMRHRCRFRGTGFEATWYGSKRK